MVRGKFIVFEGPGGCGKTTQIGNAENYLKDKGLDVLVTREPGGVDASEKIRKLIFDLKEAGVANADHQIALFFASRYILLDTLIIPAVVDKKQIVISDRYDTSTNAYQGWAEGGNKETIEKISEIVSGDFKPDAVILIRVSAETAMERKSKNREGDPFDSEDIHYFERLVAGYDDMAKNKWRDLNWYIVDGEKKKEEVAKDIYSILDVVLKDK